MFGGEKATVTLLVRWQKDREKSMANNLKAQQRSELHKTAWSIVADLEGGAR